MLYWIVEYADFNKDLSLSHKNTWWWHLLVSIIFTSILSLTQKQLYTCAEMNFFVQSN